MSEILRSLKSDLLDRRVLPILLALGLALAGAVGYIVLAGGGSSAGTTAGSSLASAAPTPTPSSAGPPLAVTEAPANPNAAVAETTDGTRYQHKAGSHNPFTPLASPAEHKVPSVALGASAASPSPSSAGSTTATTPTTPSSESTTGASTGGSTTTTPTTPSKPAAPKKPKTIYVVTVQLGLIPSTPGELSQLTPYSDLKRLQPLPSADDPRLLFAGARGNGKGAVFTLNREAILKGQAICVPSASQCEAIDLAVGQSEELTYLEPDGQSVPYELKVVSIEKQEAAIARTARRHRHHRHHK
jgi:hypothetical protein